MKHYDLTLDIYVISRLTHIYYTGELNKLGVSMGQFPFIMGIHENEGISQEKLSAALRISKSTTAVTVGQLVEKGFAERTVDPADRRNFCLKLTEKGIALIPQIKQIIHHCHVLLLEDFSDGEKKLMEELLQRLRKNSEEHFCPRKKILP